MATTGSDEHWAGTLDSLMAMNTEITVMERILRALMEANREEEGRPSACPTRSPNPSRPDATSSLARPAGGDGAAAPVSASLSSQRRLVGSAGAGLTRSMPSVRGKIVAISSGVQRARSGWCATGAG